MTEDNPAWYQTWFDTPYYHILYQDRDIAEATLFLQNLLAYLKLEYHQSILDVACGKGRHALYLASQGFQVTGIDLSPNSISFAQEEAKSKNLEVEFYVHDMRTPAHEQAAVVLNEVSSSRELVAAQGGTENLDRTDDPVRMYLREMGSVELLSREGEIAIAKRIEAGRNTMIAGLCESPLTFQSITIWRIELLEEEIMLRDVIDLETTFGQTN